MNISLAPRLGNSLAATMLARLQAVTSFLRWTCHWEIETGLVRQEGCRIWLRREACGVFWDEALFLIDVIPAFAASDLASELAQSKAVASARGAVHCTLTENGIVETMAANLRLLTKASYAPPNDNMVDEILDRELPIGGSMTLGILEARLSRRGFSKLDIRRNILRLIEESYLSIDLAEPINAGMQLFHLSPAAHRQSHEAPWEACRSRSISLAGTYSAADSVLASS
jgi:hypothetical protein